MRRISKLISIVMCITLLFSLVSCGKEEKTTDKKKAETTATAEAKDGKDEKKEGSGGEKSDMEKLLDEYAEQLPKLHKVPGHEIYLNLPNYQEIEEGYTRVFVMHQSRYMAVTYMDEEPASTLEKAHDVTIKSLINSMQDYCFPEKLNVTSSEKVTINGIEMLRYEGTMTCEDDKGVYEAYTVGYTFIMDGTACNLIGSVIDYDQGEDLKKEIKENVEASVKTIRAERIVTYW